MKCVVVTACAVGIAHTYMAAEAMERAAKKLGIEVQVETQGSVGIENELKPKDIEEADLVIIASDVGIEKSERFKDKIVYYDIPAEAIKNAQGVYERAIAFYEDKKKAS